MKSTEQTHVVPIGVFDGYGAYAVVRLDDQARERRYRKYVEHVLEQRKEGQ